MKMIIRIAFLIAVLPLVVIGFLWATLQDSLLAGREFLNQVTDWLIEP